MKKIISLLTILALAVTVFAGCGKKVADNDFTEIVIWSSDSHAKGTMEKLVEEFNQTTGKEHKVHLVWELKEGGTQELDVALQNGKEPDLFACTQLSKFAENDYIMPLEEIPQIAETVSKNSEIKVERQNVYRGKMYLMPVNATVLGLAYNKDMFKAAGIVDEKGNAKPPRTISELREDAKKLTNTSKQKYGIILPGKWSSWFGCEIQNTSLQLTGSMGYNFQKGKFDWNGLKPMVNLMLDLKKDGSVYPGMEGIDNDPARARFSEGNIGMKFAVSWDVGVWNDQFPAKCDWGIAPLPVADNGPEYYQVKSPSFSYCISKRNYDKKGGDAVSLVFNWLYSDEMQEKLCEACVYMPWRADIIENSDLKDAKKGWKDFGKMVSISAAVPPSMPSDTSAYESISADFLNRVWTEKIDVDKWIAERNKISDEGVEQYKKLHPDEDYSDRVYPDFNIQR